MILFGSESGLRGRSDVLMKVAQRGCSIVFTEIRLRMDIGFMLEFVFSNDIIVKSSVYVSVAEIFNG